MFEVHVFLGEGTVSAGNPLGFKPGGRHRVLVFVRRGAGAEHDLASATRRAEESGLIDVKLEKGGTVQPEALGSLSPHLMGAYQRALKLGTGIIVYRQPLGPDGAATAPGA